MNETKQMHVELHTFFGQPDNKQVLQFITLVKTASEQVLSLWIGARES